jgi:hypothetical protein
MPHEARVDANAPGASRLYELTFCANSSVSSGMHASWPATKWVISGDMSCAPSPGKAGSSAAPRSEKWMCPLLPSPSSYLARNVSAAPSAAAICRAPVRYRTDWSQALNASEYRNTISYCPGWHSPRADSSRSPAARISRRIRRTTGSKPSRPPSA